MSKAAIRFTDLFRYWRDLPHQRAAMAILEESIPVELLSRDSEWFKVWSQAGKQPDPSPRGNPLSVPWFSQMDSTTDQAARMCFSSSCAMLTSFLRPGSLLGPNGDDQYLKTVRTYGDTTDAAAQLRALASYGIQASYTQRASFDTIEQQIDAGIPVPCGYLHRGPVTAPIGGHWLIVCGYDATHVIVHDPFGEADLVSGATVAPVARFCRYSRKNFGRRWMVEGPGTGWAVIAQR
jgi:hypothetical protein